MNNLSISLYILQFESNPYKISGTFVFNIFSESNKTNLNCSGLDELCPYLLCKEI